MPEGAKVDWYGAQVLAVIEGAKPKAIGRVAMQVLGLAVVNIQANGQIDTGFMANSGYVITSAGEQGQPWPSGTYRSRWGPLVPRSLVPTRPAPPPGGAALHFAAEYTIYQEMRNSFLYRALEQVIPQVGGIIKVEYQGVLR